MCFDKTGTLTNSGMEVYGFNKILNNKIQSIENKNDKD